MIMKNWKSWLKAAGPISLAKVSGADPTRPHHEYVSSA